MEKGLIYKQLQDAASCPVLTGYPLAEECTFRVGGPAAYYCAPERPECLAEMLSACRRLKLPFVVLGGGSNTLFKDEGFPGLVLSTRGLKKKELIAPDRIKAGAGALVEDLTDLAQKHSLSGMEWAGGLPGTLGGGVFMNAKCYGGEFSHVVESLYTVGLDGQFKEYRAADCGFAYKDSAFQHNSEVILEATLKLAPGDKEEIFVKTHACIDDRRARGQFDFPSAGCVFKNAYEINTPAGKLIEDSGMKGATVGGARVFDKHANFIVNTGAATSAEVLELIARVKRKVKESRGYLLREEIRILP